MTTQNTYNTLVNTGLGSPAIPVAENINLWQHFETFDLLPSIEGAFDFTTSVNYTLYSSPPGTANVTFSPSGAGVELEAPTGTFEALLFPTDVQLALTKVGSTVWDTTAQCFVDASITIPADPDQSANGLYAAGFKETPSFAVLDANVIALIADIPDGRVNWFVFVNIGGVPVELTTNIPIEPGKTYRLTVLIGPPFDGGLPLARCFINGRRVAEIPFVDGSVTTLKPFVGLLEDASIPIDLTLDVHAIRVGRKFV